MLFYKIYVINPFDTEAQIGNRPLLRGYLKSGANCLVENGIPVILAYVDEGLIIREFFTGEYLRKKNLCNYPYDDPEEMLRFNDLSRFEVESITKDELFDLLPLKKNADFIKTVEKAIFNVQNGFVLSTPEDLESDFTYQLSAFQDGLTTIDPYGENYQNSEALRHRR